MLLYLKVLDVPLFQKVERLFTAMAFSMMRKETMNRSVVRLYIDIHICGFVIGSLPAA